MTVTLTPQLEAMVQAKLATGRYTDAIAVVDEAMRLLDERDHQIAWIRAELHIGLDQEARGELVEWTPGSMARLSAEADERSRLGLPVKDAVNP